MLVRVLIHGARGRMGQALLAAAEGAGVAVAGGVDAGAVEAPAGPAQGVEVRAGWPVADGVDVVIDFTRPAGAMAALDWCVAHGKGLVLGTTGLLPGELARVEAASQAIPICRAANFSLGVNLCAMLLEQAARALGSGFDVEIVEAHHRHKVDAPSGTALMLGEAVARGLGRGLEEGPGAVYAREGHTGARPAGTIGFATVRGGDVVGEHTVMFLGEGERLEVTHRATSRGNFAVGALRAGRWLAGRVPGMYSMRDVLAPT